MSGLLGHISTEDQEYIDRVGLENFLKEINPKTSHEEKRAGVAQKAEQLTCNQKTGGSTPLAGSRRGTMDKIGFLSDNLKDVRRKIASTKGRLSQLEMERDCLKAELAEEKLKASGAPKVGDLVYVGSSFYIDHGEDDFVGGLCKVSHVELGTSAGKKVPFVSVKERSGHSYNWEYLKKHQAEWKKKFGKRRGYADPDFG